MQKKPFAFACPLNNHNANPKNNPEHAATCSPFSIMCFSWLIPGTGRVQAEYDDSPHPSSFTSCLQLGLEWAEDKVILLYTDPNKLY